VSSAPVIVMLVSGAKDEDELDEVTDEPMEETSVLVDDEPPPQATKIIANKIAYIF
jgi:hypothetical protein